jgi:predicted DsbA family dithiol-disulfide isomerase
MPDVLIHRRQSCRETAGRCGPSEGRGTIAAVVLGFGMPKTLKVDIWSDIACPWCYIGKRRFESALNGFEHKPLVSVTWRSFELDPSAPAQRDTSQRYAERLAHKYSQPVAQAEQRIAQIVSLAAAEGLPFDFEQIKPGNTFDAHRLLHLAHDRGLGDAFKERLLRGYLCEGVAIGDRSSLLSLADQFGMNADEAQGVLSSDSYASAVRADQREAMELGIRGVPFFRIGRYGVSGAQPAEVLLQGLQQAWAELPEPLETLGSDATVCGPDGCV